MIPVIGYQLSVIGYQERKISLKRAFLSLFTDNR